SRFVSLIHSRRCAKHTTPPTISALSIHDALPILRGRSPQQEMSAGSIQTQLRIMSSAGGLLDANRFTGKDSILSGPAGGVVGFRSEEHTSELQSRENLVCRLLLEKKNTPNREYCS